ncbi:MAG: hypothetical protein WC505_07025 [Patescibacteria group bacterium]
MTTPNKIRVRGDVYELVKNVAPLAQMDLADEMSQDMRLAQNEFVTTVENVIDAVDEIDPRGLASPIAGMAAPIGKIFTKAQGILKLFQHDKISVELYKLEYGRWYLVHELVRVAYHFARQDYYKRDNKLDIDTVVSALDYDKTLKELRQDHERYYAAAASKILLRFIKAGSEDDTPVVQDSKTRRELDLSAVTIQRIKDTIKHVLQAALDLGTATAETLDKYDSAARHLAAATNLAKEIAKAPQMLMKPEPLTPPEHKERIDTDATISKSVEDEPTAIDPRVKHGTYLHYAGKTYRPLT